MTHCAYYPLINAFTLADTVLTMVLAQIKSQQAQFWVSVDLRTEPEVLVIASFLRRHTDISRLFTRAQKLIATLA